MPLKLAICDSAGRRTERYVDETELPLVIGRKPPATLVIGDDVALSSTHCRLELSADGSMLLTDLGSKNGTRVNDVALQPAETQCVNVGDCIGAGRTTLVVEFFFAAVSDAEDDAEDDGAEHFVEAAARCATCAKSFVGWSDAAMTAHVVDCHLAHGGASASPSAALSCPSCRMNLAGMDDVAASVHIDRCAAVPACPLCHRVWLDWDEDVRAEHAAQCGAIVEPPASAKRARRRAPPSSLSAAPMSFKRISKRQARLAWAVGETASARVKLVAAQAALDTADWSVRVQALRKDVATCERVLADRSNHAQWIEGGAPLQSDWPQRREAMLRKEVEAATALRAELDAHVRALAAEADLLAGQIALAQRSPARRADKRDAAASSPRLAPLSRQ